MIPSLKSSTLNPSSFDTLLLFMGLTIVGTLGEFQMLAKILSSAKVLLVEDSPDSRILLTRILSRAGAQITEAESASEAREKLASFRPNIIISDIGMPEENVVEDGLILTANGPEASEACAITFINLLNK